MRKTETLQGGSGEVRGDCCHMGSSFMFYQVYILYYNRIAETE